MSLHLLHVQKNKQTQYLPHFQSVPENFVAIHHSVSRCQTVSHTSTPQTQLPIKLTVNVQHHFKTD